MYSTNLHLIKYGIKCTFLIYMYKLISNYKPVGHTRLQRQERRISVKDA